MVSFFQLTAIKKTPLLVQLDFFRPFLFCDSFFTELLISTSKMLLSLQSRQSSIVFWLNKNRTAF